MSNNLNKITAGIWLIGSLIALFNGFRLWNDIPMHFMPWFMLAFVEFELVRQLLMKE